jgi:hypothetical protein
MKRLLFAALLVSTIAASAPQLLRTAKLALSMRGLPDRERRARLMGPFFPSIGNVLRATPANETLALVMPHGQSIDAALFFDYYAYPRRTRIYPTSAHYGADARAPRTFVRVGDVAELSSYPVMRFDDLQRIGPAVRNPPLREAGTHFVVPMAASIDGIVPSRYVIEATLAAEKPEQVTLTFWPRGTVRTLTVDRQRRFLDLVYEVFGVIDRGWLEISSTESLRASFALVSHGATKAATSLPHSEGAASELAIVRDVPRAPLRIAAGKQLWLVNLDGAAAGLRVNGSGDLLAPHDTVSRSIECPCVVEADAHVYAFATEKMADGGTRFFWPEQGP